MIFPVLLQAESQEYIPLVARQWRKPEHSAWMLKVLGINPAPPCGGVCFNL
jgi:hypothetical protein